jgi:hypothetical protein
LARFELVFFCFFGVDSESAAGFASVVTRFVAINEPPRLRVVGGAARKRSIGAAGGPNI